MQVLKGTGFRVQVDRTLRVTPKVETLGVTLKVKIEHAISSLWRKNII